MDGAWENKEIAPEFLNVIETETDRMMRMITDLLNLSRMDQNRLELDKEFVNMNELGETYCQPFRYGVSMTNIVKRTIVF